jgi:hypothetical protein
MVFDSKGQQLSTMLRNLPSIDLSKKVERSTRTLSFNYEPRLVDVNLDEVQKSARTLVSYARNLKELHFYADIDPSPVLAACDIATKRCLRVLKLTLCCEDAVAIALVSPFTFLQKLEIQGRTGDHSESSTSPIHEMVASIAEAWTISTLTDLTVDFIHPCSSCMTAICAFLARCRFEALQVISFTIVESELGYEPVLVSHLSAFFRALASNPVPLQRADFSVPNNVLVSIIPLITASRIGFNLQEDALTEGILAALSPNVRDIDLLVYGTDLDEARTNVWPSLETIELYGSRANIRTVTMCSFVNGSLLWNLAEEEEEEETIQFMGHMFAHALRLQKCGITLLDEDNNTVCIRQHRGERSSSERLNYIEVGTQHLSRHLQHN